jgi:prepilin-type N-terminal cleavage/methylation domain-containing protein
MKFTNSSKGLTLIEIVVSMAIFGIVIVSFLSIFTTGFMGIVRAGQRADAAYLSQQKMTNKIIQEGSFIGTTTITYDFSASGGPSIPINVSILEAETVINGNASKMKSFIPTP